VRDTRKTGRNEALEEMWRASEWRERERRRRENGARWYAFHMGLADAHASLAGEHEANALELLEGFSETHPMEGEEVSSGRNETKASET